MRTLAGWQDPACRLPAPKPGAKAGSQEAFLTDARTLPSNSIRRQMLLRAADGCRDGSRLTLLICRVENDRSTAFITGTLARASA